MNVAKKAPYFSHCGSRGERGCIVYADGTMKTGEFETIPDGLAALAALVASRKISWDESLDVKLQIEESKLKSESQAADEYAYAVWLMTHDALERQMFEESDDRRESAARRKGRVTH